ncbi:response regulator [Telluribacter sp.]|jgi:DNA-binding response OmpR family regulator|uniref:response regulator n=1 Tax=Telluribacter sp. TaxID=1978767 RepID=UPI002E0EC5EE|nr:response regulator [Telluribacter sp.]
MRIVIIEDEVDLGILIQNFLLRQVKMKSPSTTIKVATTIGEGLAIVNELKPQWLLLDNNLPDGKGINEIENIKQNSLGIQIIMMSAMSNLREEALKKGADYFLDKPISFGEITRIINNQTPLSD